MKTTPTYNPYGASWRLTQHSMDGNHQVRHRLARHTSESYAYSPFGNTPAARIPQPKPSSDLPQYMNSTISSNSRRQCLSSRASLISTRSNSSMRSIPSNTRQGIL